MDHQLIVPLTVKPGRDCFYLVSPADGYIAKTVSDHQSDEANAHEMARRLNAYPALVAQIEALLFRFGHTAEDDAEDAAAIREADALLAKLRAG